jgi:predicted Zn-dependent protease
MLLQLAPITGALQQSVPASMEKAGWRRVSAERTTVNGLEAYVGTYDRVANNQRTVARVAHIRAGQRVYVVAGVAPASSFNGSLNTFNSAIGTFRTLSRAEADRIQPNRLDFYTARSGDTWESIARNQSDATIKPSTLAIMNGSEPGTQPRAGQRLRIVVSGS